MGVDSEKEESQDCVSIILTTCWRQNNKEKNKGNLIHWQCKEILDMSMEKNVVK